MSTEPPLMVELPNPSISFAFSRGDRLDHIAALIERDGIEMYEKPTSHMISLLTAGRRGIALDVGANTGIFSLLMAAGNPELTVCAFEPLESIRSVLAANIALNPDLASRINIVPLGLSNRVGEFTFYENINNIGLIPTSSSLELSHALISGEHREQRIETTTLDEWSKGIDAKSILFVKIDVEGHEHAVLTGARQTLAKARPLLILEVLGSSNLEGMDAMVNETQYLDFALAPHALRQCQRLYHHGDAWNHLLCPIEQTHRIFSCARALGLSIELG